MPDEITDAETMALLTEEEREWFKSARLAVACSFEDEQYIMTILRRLALARREVAYRDEMLIDCLFQWGYEGTKSGVPVLSSGGLSTLEYLLRMLGLPDPCPVADAEAFAARIRAHGDAGRGDGE